MHTGFLLFGFAALAQPGALVGQSVTPSAQVAASVLPLPEALRDGAGVRVAGPGGMTILRPSSNGLMCTADRPGDDVFDVRCYNVAFLAVMDFVRTLPSQNLSDSALDDLLKDAVRQGRIRFPASPTAGYRMLGPISGFNPVTGAVTEAIDQWQSIHFPFRTAEELGLPVTPEGVMPFVMASGSWWSHVMIVHRPDAEP